eukprot:TRINITY_DN4244_c0_g1_i1.p1 TRINITY_DN4244_c0_g1~~TRINITY_DN4244_c0_g1_i1.p1  ORF type:complete len:497 (+),score=128.87 TRINITY_DN4244_c0_g1_i1:39-1493(+)
MSAVETEVESRKPRRRTRAERDGGNPATAEADEEMRYELDPELVKKAAKYARLPEEFDPKLLAPDSKEASHPRNRHKRKNQMAAVNAARAELLLSEEAGSILQPVSKPLTQEDILEQVDIQTASKVYNVELEMGSYVLDYSRVGRHLVIGGRKGHLAMIDWKTQKVQCELQLKETIRDVKFLHNHLMFAAAQRNHVYIYNSDGVELHCLTDQRIPLALDFLPFHFLLTSVGQDHVLTYRDTSTGEKVAAHKFNQAAGPSSGCMRQNPKNAVIALGHQRGLVTMWTPNMAEPVVKMVSHRGNVLGMCFDHSQEHQMITTGTDNLIKFWDLRTFKELCTKRTRSPVNSIDVSMTGVLALGRGSCVDVFKVSDFAPSAEDLRLPRPFERSVYEHDAVSSLKFCPYEDVLGIGREGGYSSILVPGAGEANYDALEVNPFETVTQRKEREVRQLLEKLQPDMITLDDRAFGRFRSKPVAVSSEDKEQQQ